MSPLQAVMIRYLRCVSDVRVVLSRPRYVLPFAFLSFIELVALTGYVLFPVPPFSTLWPVAMRALFGPEILHYPDHILRLPEVLGWVRAGVGVFGGFLLLGWGVSLIEASLAEKSVARQNSWRGLVVPWFIANAVWTLLLVAIAPALDQLGELRVVGRLAPLWQTLRVLARPITLVVIAYSMFFAISERNASGLGALRHAGHFVISHWPETLLIAAMALVLSSPFELLVAQSDWFVRSAHPRLEVLWVSSAVLWDAVVRFFVFVSAVSLEMNRSENRG